MNAEDAERIVADKSNHELLAILARQADWQPSVIEAAKALLQQRDIEFTDAEIESAGSRRDLVEVQTKAGLNPNWWGYCSVVSATGIFLFTYWNLVTMDGLDWISRLDQSSDILAGVVWRLLELQDWIPIVLAVFGILLAKGRSKRWCYVGIGLGVASVVAISSVRSFHRQRIVSFGTIAGALDSYYNSHGQYPAGLQDLSGIPAATGMLATYVPGSQRNEEVTWTPAEIAPGIPNTGGFGGKQRRSGPRMVCYLNPVALGARYAYLSSGKVVRIGSGSDFTDLLGASRTGSHGDPARSQ